jgi:hypothetical protein
MNNENRNPLFIPSPSPDKKISCPKCEGDFVGRVVQGVVLATCKKCGHKWQGGLPQSPVPPGQVLMPEKYVPPVRFGKDLKGNDVEIRRRVNLAQEFRKGSPLEPEE